MPFYRCLIPPGSLSFDQRQAISAAITDVHCGLTNAPRRFVNVIFLEVDDGSEIADSHGNGTLSYKTPYFVAGGNRAGRAPEMKQQILDELLARISEISGVPRHEVSGHISDAPASWTMEGGKILPDPGAESAEWYDPVGTSTS